MKGNPPPNGGRGRPRGTKNKPKGAKAYNFAQAQSIKILQALVSDPDNPEGPRIHRNTMLWNKILKSDNESTILQSIKFLTLCAFGRPPEAKKPEPIETPQAEPDKPLTEAEWLEKHGQTDASAS